MAKETGRKRIKTLAYDSRRGGERREHHLTTTTSSGRAQSLIGLKKRVELESMSSEQKRKP